MSSRGHRDRHDGGPDPDGGGVQKHRLDFYRGESGAFYAEPSGNVWLDLTGAHWHYHLDHLVHFVVPLEQADFGAVNQHGGAHGEDKWLLPLPSSISTHPSPCD